MAVCLYVVLTMLMVYYFATATSKFHNVMADGELSPRSFGLNGEALASLSDISVVEIRTKARGRPNSYCKIIKAPLKH